MKTLHILPSLILLCLLLPLTAIAQDEDTSQAFWIHEDPVYPAVVADYETYCTDLVTNCKKYGIKKANWQTISTDDLKYFHISPIKDMADLDNSRFSVLQEKMGEEDFNNLFDNFDSCYDTHTDYIVHLDKELSYHPKGSSMSDGLFRKMEFWYTTPKNFSKMVEIAKGFKALYEDKNSQEYYDVYRSGFGASGQYLLVVITANSAEEYEAIRKANKELLGTERDAIYNTLLSTIQKVDILTGYLRPDLSYTPEE